MAHITGSGIHSSAIIGNGVEIGQDVSVGPFAVLLGPASIGDGSSIGPGARIGGPPEISTLPQRRGWMGEAGYGGVRIGERCVIRENAVIHQGSERETEIGDRTWVLNSVYVAHDVQIGSDVTISAGVVIGGYAWIGDFANIGMNAAIHQRRAVGAGCMIGMGTPLTRDAPPFAKVYGVPPRLRGINRTALDRAGLSSQAAQVLDGVYVRRTSTIEDVVQEAGDPDLYEHFSRWMERANAVVPPADAARVDA